MKSTKLLLSLGLALSCLFGCSTEPNINYTTEEQTSETVQLPNIPKYNGNPYTKINGNVPNISESELQTETYETYSELDELGRCGTAEAVLGLETMPTEDRGSIGMVKPSGWQTIRYDGIVDGNYLYNRCHLIAFQLSSENANEKKLITGTRYMNVEGMLPFENMVADYIKETENHVFYRVTPIFEGDNLVANGVQMEAYSIEDAGSGIEFNVFVYNVQPQIEIDYATGESRLVEETTNEDTTSEETIEIRGNKNSKIYHMPGQDSYEEMADSKNLVIFHSEQEAQAAGYRKAKR